MMDLVIEHIGVQIDAVGPDDRPGFSINPNLSEKTGVLKSRKDAAATSNRRAEIDGSLRAIRKGQEYKKGRPDFDHGNARVQRKHVHSSGGMGNVVISAPRRRQFHKALASNPEPDNPREECCPSQEEPAGLLAKATLELGFEQGELLS
jgi:hypothetical protein